MSEAELRKLADTLDPLLRTATGVWLLRDTASDRLARLVLAQDSVSSRLPAPRPQHYCYRLRQHDDALRMNSWLSAHSAWPLIYINRIRIFRH
ncbi:hypothetical protein [Achromobacter sp.]|uniref:hypothetical protein n=1 Tax=Achromobacter sp. TaxID=134375 RepID=UPI003C78AF60